MALEPGKRLGPYEVLGPIGAGGMGEVYRARDSKLGRDVAIKVLPEAFASDGKRLARFEREAKTLASLNHPNIAAIYGIEESQRPRWKWQVSTGGGAFPTWSRNRKELFYRTLEFTFMVVPYAAEGDSFRAEKPRQWSPGRLSSGIGNRTFDLHPDGQRFAVLKAAEQEKRDKVVFIENFFDELRRVAPAVKR